MERTRLNAVLRETGCAGERAGFVFLRDPTDTAGTIADPTTSAGDRRNEPVSEGWLCLRTGGSGGGVRFARHDETTLGAAVRGFVEHFGIARVNTVAVLPPWHVSGLMARVRSAATGGTCLQTDWKALEAGVLPDLRGGADWVISLVPTQLQRLLGSAAAVDWLRRFRVVLLGGGPVWAELAEAAAKAGVPAAMSYGMTETAAMVAAQLPADFAAGDRSSGRPMPHARIRVDPDGRVHVAGDSVFRGYFPEWRGGREFATDDLGRIDERGRVHILGRRDAVIITGGKKVQPLEVEAALRASGEFDDVAVIGVPDPEWGEMVVACYPAGQRAPETTRAVVALASYQRPKRFVAIAEWPRNAQGKINRARLLALVEASGA